VPEIPLLDEAGNPLSELEMFLTVRGIMWLPKDLDSVLNYRALGAPGQPGLTNLFKETTLKLMKQDTGGTIAAHVFLQLLSFKRYRPDDASVNKAVFVVSRKLEKLGHAAPSDRRNVRKFWNAFTPAAHLWGAARLLNTIGLEPQTDDEIGSFPVKVLLVGELLLRAARELGWQFDPDPWRLPDLYPRKAYQFDLPVPLPTDEDIELLRKYRAPTHK
jgi:hypothetical protein